MKIIVKGIVQAVGFRPTVARIAKEMNLSGYVVNRGSYVEIFVEQREKEFVDRLLKEKPPLAVIDDVSIIDEPPSFSYKGFQILESKKDEIISTIPPDIALCDKCIEELFDPSNRRYMYPFINCTDCGARFTAIYAMPYDRQNTTMKFFPMCDECMHEYKNMESRRYHAQTISCPSCGPRYRLYDSSGNEIEGDVIRKYAELMDAGYIGIMKSWGGMHITGILETANRIRAIYNRRSKPFAVMVRDVETAKKYAFINENEEKLLLSPQRPIVLVDKKEELEDISPGLPNIGLYLPYTATHHIIFHYLKHDALIMTSANLPGEPMVIENEDAFILDADYYLLHNRKIANRADDSLVRVYDGKRLFIRKSRGFIPCYIKVPYSTNVFAAGAEMNLAFTVSKKGIMYPSQYIGNVSKLSNYLYMEEMLSKFIDWLDVKFEAVAIDMHPKYASRRIASKIKDMHSAPLIEIQHHWAHAMSIALEHNMEEIVAIVMDGTGYGMDGNSWGGEVLYATPYNFKRVSHLEYYPLIGGDRAVMEPMRIVFAWKEMTGREMKIFDDKKENMMLAVMNDAIKTSSMGRFLDGLSAYFGICRERSYDGEPAMKLEGYIDGKDLDFPYNSGEIIKLKPIIEHVFDSRERKNDVIYSAVRAVIRGMVETAIDEAGRHGMNFVGVTGGVAYNKKILSMIEQELKKHGFGMLIHDKIPPGDGGIAYGQNFIAGMKFQNTR
ncbi:MAG: carbamoyltransferase HypF [Thermoplasmata archaeon]|nr:carbamoyltransferase HypF [Thermoplasmata archaeon]